MRTTAVFLRKGTGNREQGTAIDWESTNV